MTSPLTMPWLFHPQLQNSWWDASAQNKDHRLTELGAIFLYGFLSQHTAYSNNNNDTKRRNSYCVPGASTGSTFIGSSIHSLAHSFICAANILLRTYYVPRRHGFRPQRHLQPTKEPKYLFMELTFDCMEKDITYENISISDKNYE